MALSHGTNHSKGVMILINPSLDCKSAKIITDKNGRFIIQKLSLDEQAIVLQPWSKHLGTVMKIKSENALLK